MVINLSSLYRWRQKLAWFMSTNAVQYTIIFLVVVDSLIVVFELLIDMDIITSKSSSSDLFNCFNYITTRVIVVVTQYFMI